MFEPLKNTNIQKLPRDPLRFEPIKLLSDFIDQENLSLNHPELKSSFSSKINDSIDQALQNEAFLHGFRVEAMFEGLVASLGKVRLLKKEDAGGSIYAAEEGIKIPDFRVVLEDGNNWFVEVKNFHAKDPSTNFSLNMEYLHGLIRYSEMAGGKLKIAVFWSKWKSWALVDPSIFKNQGNNEILTYPMAMCGNELGALGDFMVGTEFPLKIKLLTDPNKERTVREDGQVQYTISGFELYCNDKQLLKKVEQDIFYFLIQFGNWEEQPTEAIIKDSILEAMEFTWMPLEDQGKGFESLGFLSSMYSKYFIQKSLGKDKVAQISVNVEPGYLGKLIPNDYHGEALPLWLMVIQPSDAPEIEKHWEKVL